MSLSLKIWCIRSFAINNCLDKSCSVVGHARSYLAVPFYQTERINAAAEISPSVRPDIG
jgi:hypothetical protein